MPLTFWIIRQELGLVLKVLAQMAKDFLSCPGVYPALGHVFHPLICLQLCQLMLNKSSHFLARLSIPSARLSVTSPCAPPLCSIHGSPFWPSISKAPSRRSSHKGGSVGPIATNLRGLYFWTRVLIPSTMSCNSKSSCTQNLLMMKHMRYILGGLICYHKWVGE